MDGLILPNVNSYLILLILFVGVTTCRNGNVLSATHRIRHSGRNLPSDLITNVLEDSDALQGIQDRILNTLGLKEPPPVTNVEIPDYMREILKREIDTENEIIEEESHFMADSANVLLIATQVHSQHLGETMQFKVSPEDRAERVYEAKLYFHINPMEISMHNDNTTDSMWLRLTLMKKQSDGTVVPQVVEEKIIINANLVGWHNYEIAPTVLRQVFQTAAESGDIHLDFQLTCMNCRFDLFPEVITKQNVPFLTMNGRRRSRRNGNRGCTGSCCLKELIVDFNALGSKWNFVIHPRRYQANYCSGSCVQPSPRDRAQMPSNTHILNEMLSRQREAATSSCCVAADEERVLLAYYVDGGAVRTNNNAIKRIKSCRCV